MKVTRVGSIMTTDVITAEYGTPFKEVVRRLENHGISGLPVIDEDDKVIGVISQSDLMLRQVRSAGSGDTSGVWTQRLRGLSRRVRHEAAKSRARTAGGVMSAPAVTVRADATVSEAARLMTEHGIKRLPVVDEEDRLTGIVTRRDLLQVFLRTDDSIEHTVRKEVLGRTLSLGPYAVAISVRDGVVTLTGRLERRSDIAVALRTTGRVDGVVAVVDQLSYRVDDTRLRPAEPPAVHGVADGWISRL
ncbi:CBS domain-containing protein [Streptomyces sp. NPDC086080]|uniref:CBS domain-containing protein n=1 Tax=Streptomyces sp. NPDC086080 TaxID=3365748 RepID=UPI0037D0021F